GDSGRHAAPGPRQSTRPRAIATCRSSRPARRLAGDFLAPDDDPAVRIVILKILAPGDPPENHRLGDPPLFWTHGEVHVRNHEAHEADAREKKSGGSPSRWFSGDRKSTRLNSSHQINSYAVSCLQNTT